MVEININCNLAAGINTVRYDMEMFKAKLNDTIVYVLDEYENLSIEEVEVNKDLATGIHEIDEAQFRDFEVSAKISLNDDNANKLFDAESCKNRLRQLIAETVDKYEGMHVNTIIVY